MGRKPACNPLPPIPRPTPSNGVWVQMVGHVGPFSADALTVAAGTTDHRGCWTAMLPPFECYLPIVFNLSVAAGAAEPAGAGVVAAGTARMSVRSLAAWLSSRSMPPLWLPGEVRRNGHSI